ncbi:hypothetical protein D3C72_1600210 [compost metagenome]
MPAGTSCQSASCAAIVLSSPGVYCFIGLEANQLSASSPAIFLVNSSASRVFSSLFGRSRCCSASHSGRSICGSRSICTLSPGCQNEEICRIAGPLRPRWVNRMFSRKLWPLQLTRQSSTEVPDNSVHSVFSCGSVIVKGTSPARVGSRVWPNCRATW